MKKIIEFPMTYIYEIVHSNEKVTYCRFIHVFSVYKHTCPYVYPSNE